jgi:thiosulfate/3-mercaptopyruvate sulfurtransferase
MKNLINAQELNAKLELKHLIILDASTTENENRMCIPGAKNFDLKTNFKDHTSSLPNTIPSPDQFERNCRALGINKDSEIVIYDNKGTQNSPRAWWLFKVMGHENVAVLNGGLPDWIEEGLKTETIVFKDVEAGSFESNFNASYFRDLKFMKENADNSRALVVDARSAGRFAGTEEEPREGLQSGQIPNSVNLPKNEVLENEKIKSKEALKEVFKSFEKEERELVFSCGSGSSACILMLAAEEVLEGPKSIYDGSWTEWAIHHGLTK